MIRQDIDGGQPFDWGKSSKEYARWRDIYPPDFYAALQRAGFALAGQRVLDIGTGTGVLPRALHARGASFVGVDISAEQIAQARRLAETAGITDITWLALPAEEIDFDGETFDAAMACQCFHYMDVERLMPRLHRMLRPGGLFGIFFMNWLPRESAVAAASERLVLRQNPAWSGGDWTPEKKQTAPWAAQAGFSVVRDEVLRMDVPFTREGWNGRMKACRGVTACMDEGEVRLFERRHLQMLRETAEETFSVPHAATILVLRKNPESAMCNTPLYRKDRRDADIP